nr:hypothetical protein [Tanacetum cinerariifolium]
MPLTFAETHNIVAYLSKSDASEGFNQIIDFLNGSSIKFQALVDRKKVVVTEATLREALRLDDLEGVDCLSNEESFAELARMGYEKPSTKLTKQVGNLSTHTTKYTSPTLTQKVFANMRRVGKGFSGVETPLFEGMLVEQEIDEEGDTDEHVKEVNTGDAAEGDDSAAHGEVPTVAEEQSIPSLTPPTPPPQPPQDIPSTSQVKQTPPQSPSVQPPSPQPQLQPQQAANFPMRVVIRDPKEESTTSTIIPVETKSKDKGKGIWVEEPKPLKKKQQIEQDEQYTRELHVELNKDIDWDEAIDHVKLKAKEDPAVKKYQAMKRKPQTKAQARKNIMMYLKNVAGFKLDYFKGMSYDDIRLIFKAKFNSNVAFLLTTKEQIKEDKNRALQTINKTPVKRAAKRRKLDEEVEELKRHLHIVPNEDEDVYTKATPLARKVPVVDYEI